MTRFRPTRRRVLAAALGTVVSAMGGPALGACTTGESSPPGPDALEPVATRAEEDTLLAEAVAAAHPDLAPSATALAADRRQHANALRAELRRVRPAPPSASLQAPATLIMAPGDLGAARAVLVDALRAAQEQAVALVGGAPGHRAALLASIVACCASHEAVLP